MAEGNETDLAPRGYLGRALEAFTSPKTSAKRMLLAQPSRNEALMMVVAGYAISAGLLQAAELAAPEILKSNEPQVGPDGEPLPQLGLLERHAFELVLTLLQFWIVSSLAWFIGVQAGGKASRRQIMGLVAWHTLATAPLSPVVSVAAALTLAQLASIMAPLVLIAAGLYVLYIFAAFIAVAHGFRSVGQVMMATFGVSIAGGLLFSIIASIIGAA